MLIGPVDDIVEEIGTALGVDPTEDDEGWHFVSGVLTVDVHPEWESTDNPGIMYPASIYVRFELGSDAVLTYYESVNAEDTDEVNVNITSHIDLSLEQIDLLLEGTRHVAILHTFEPLVTSVKPLWKWDKEIGNGTIWRELRERDIYSSETGPVGDAARLIQLAFRLFNNESE